MGLSLVLKLDGEKPFLFFRYIGYDHNKLASIPPPFLLIQTSKCFII